MPWEPGGREPLLPILWGQMTFLWPGKRMQPTVCVFWPFVLTSSLAKNSLKGELEEVRLFLRFKVNAISHNTPGKTLDRTLEPLQSRIFKILARDGAEGKKDISSVSMCQALRGMLDNVTSCNIRTSFARQPMKSVICGHPVCYEHHPDIFIISHVINSAFQHNSRKLATPASLPTTAQAGDLSQAHQSAAPAWDFRLEVCCVQVKACWVVYIAGVGDSRRVLF